MQEQNIALSSVYPTEVDFDEVPDIRYFVIGFLRNNVFMFDTQDGVVVVDPSAVAEKIIDLAKEQFGKPITHIICTHNHSDHVKGIADIKQATGAVVIASQTDSPLIEDPELVRQRIMPLHKACHVDVKVNGGDVIELGQSTWEVIATPGHTSGGICFLLTKYKGKKPTFPILFSGDTLFAGTTGRTDFVGGSDRDMSQSMARLATLPDNTFVLPGHYAFTTIAAERPTTIAFWTSRF
ncbi:MAG: MBL fold metallo-hydrolase [Eggerthellaceae bacterium]|nr:MBL fold metallo-hydrolase [Eggerthellaceae bacterium]